VRVSAEPQAQLKCHNALSLAGIRQCFTQAGTDSMIVIRRRLGFMTGPGASGFKFRPGRAESLRPLAASLSLSQVLQFVPSHGQFVLNVTRRPTLAAGVADTDPRRGRRPGVRWPELEPGPRPSLRLAGPPPGLLCCPRSAAAGDRDLGTGKRCLTRAGGGDTDPRILAGRPWAAPGLRRRRGPTRLPERTYISDSQSPPASIIIAYFLVITSPKRDVSSRKSG
jgi:hypothetical protein